MIKKILLVFAALLAILAAVIALQPKDYKITRSLAINVPPDTVFPFVNDFHQWRRWSPFETLDPEMQRTFEGPDSGQGAKYHWNGNDAAGSGTMTIIESVPSSRVRMQLDFTRPMTSTANVEFVLEPIAGGTKVTWTMFGENNFIGKAVHLFVNIDSMMGEYYEQGLSNLKKKAEDAAQL